VFIDEFLQTDIDGSWQNSTIFELCRSREWVEGLIIKCDATEGGVANVRNVVLNCLRYAIEAGATGFVSPEISVLTAAETQTPVHLSHFFDFEHFKSSLTSTCPQLRIYDHQNDLYDLPSTAKAVSIAPGSLHSGPLLHGTILTNPGNWSTSFKAFLNTSRPDFSAQKPVLVNLGNPLLQFPLSYDDPRLISNFGRILRFRPDVRRVAAAVLYALSKKHDLKLDPGRISEGKFYGAHLRTGNDAKVAGWTGYEVQSANYLATAEHYKLPAIYLVSSSASSISAFTLAASNSSIGVETKTTLLGGADGRGERGFEDEWKALGSMNWDVQLLIDYEVLLHSSIFGGIWESSFSWGVAMRRHIVASGEGGWKGIGEKRKRSYDLEQKVEYDELARVQRRGGSVLSVKEKRADDAEPHVKTVNAPEGSPEYLVKVGDTSFKDSLSVVFGPKGEGKRIIGSMWP